MPRAVVCYRDPFKTHNAMAYLPGHTLTYLRRSGRSSTACTITAGAAGEVELYNQCQARLSINTQTAYIQTSIRHTKLRQHSRWGGGAPPHPRTLFMQSDAPASCTHLIAQSGSYSTTYNHGTAKGMALALHVCRRCRWPQQAKSHRP